MKRSAVNLAISLLIFWKGSALLCNKCSSTKSWKDCEEHFQVLNCSANDVFNVCWKVHLVERKNGTEFHQYSKNCGLQSLCSGEECAQRGDWCQVDCCNQDNCNRSAASIKPTCISFLFMALLTAI